MYCLLFLQIFESSVYKHAILWYTLGNPGGRHPVSRTILPRISTEQAQKGAEFMKYIINGRNLEVSDRLRNQVEKKLNKLDRFFNPDTVVHVTLSLQKDSQKIEVTIPVRGNIIRAEQESSDMYVSIDLVEEVIERQLKRYKTKLVTRKQNAESFSAAFLEEEEAPDTEEDDGIRIVKTKRFAIKPMDPEEACLQMELLGHSFYVFFNADTNQTNVVYKRKDGTFGLIEPEF